MLSRKKKKQKNCAINFQIRKKITAFTLGSVCKPECFADDFFKKREKRIKTEVVLTCVKVRLGRRLFIFDVGSLQFCAIV